MREVERQDREWERVMDASQNKGCGPTLLGLLVAVVLTCLCSCKTIKSMESHAENNTEVLKDSSDTVREHKDSTNIEHKTTVKKKEKTNTDRHTERKDSTVTVVDKDGNVIGTKEYHWLRESLKESSERERSLEDSLAVYRQLSDSLAWYKEKYDSLSSVKQGERTVEVEKKQSTWRDYCLLLIGLYFIAAGIYICIHSRKKNS